MRYKKSVFRSLAMVTQLGLCVLTPILLAIAAGSYIDSRYGTKTMLALLILGVLGGGRGAYMMAKGLIEQEARQERAERERVKQEVLSSPRTVSRPKRPSRILREGASPESGSGDAAARDSAGESGCVIEKEAGS